MSVSLGPKMTDLKGNIYGRWTVLQYAGRSDSNNSPMWLCRCECGNKKNIHTVGLVSGSSKSCGCLRSELTSILHKERNDRRREVLIGRKFHKLTVIEVSHIDIHRTAHYRCRCDCGNITVVNGSSLKKNHTKSCGCLIAEVASTHKLSKHPLFSVWINMRRRCNKEDYYAYPNYGGRGITVCEEWHKSFKSFYDWAIDNGYHKGLSIDRIDNDKGYSPDNCRWTTYTEQARNTRSTKLNIKAVRDIRESKQSSRELSEKYNVTMGHINEIRANNVWKDV